MSDLQKRIDLPIGCGGLLQKWLSLEANPLETEEPSTSGAFGFASIMSAEEVRIVGLDMPCVCIMVPPAVVKCLKAMTQVHTHLCMCLHLYTGSIPHDLTVTFARP